MTIAEIELQPGQKIFMTEDGKPDIYLLSSPACTIANALPEGEVVLTNEGYVILYKERVNPNRK